MSPVLGFHEKGPVKIKMQNQTQLAPGRENPERSPKRAPFRRIPGLRQRRENKMPYIPRVNRALIEQEFSRATSFDDLIERLSAGLEQGAFMYAYILNLCARPYNIHEKVGFSLQIESRSCLSSLPSFCLPANSSSDINMVFA